MAKKRKQLRGRVEKLIKSKHSGQPEMAQIAIDGGRICTAKFAWKMN